MQNFFEKIPFIDYMLKGTGQIMLQENRWTGLLFLTGIFLGSWQCGLGAMLATTAGTLTAMLLKFNQKEITAGLYGFSAALVGVVLAFLFQTTLLIWILIIVGGGLASILQHFFIQKKFPAFTFPFVATAWILVFLLHHYTQIPPSDLFYKKMNLASYGGLFTGIRGFGQVIFQGTMLSGALFFLGVFISSPIAALYGLAASLLGALIAQLSGQPLDSIHLGLFGFNAVLSAIAFAGVKKTDGFWVLIASVLSIYINIFLVNHPMLDALGGVLTFPFVAGTWIALFVRRRLSKVFTRT